MAFVTRGTYLQAVVKALEKSGHLQPLREAVSARTATMLTTPHAETWWPAECVIELLLAAERRGGFTLVEDTCAGAIDQYVTPLMRSMLRIAISLSGRTPSTALSRMDQMVSVTNRGVTTRWEQATPRSGKLHVDYDLAVPPVVGAVWTGTVRSILSSFRVQGTCRIVETLPAGFVLEVSW